VRKRPVVIAGESSIFRPNTVGRTATMSNLR
jgi:hypothetical protein